MIKLKCKRLISIMLLSSFSCLIAAQHNVNKAKAPEATAIEDTLPFFDIPDLKEAFIDTKPTDKKDGMRVGKLGIDGGNKEIILKLAHEIAKNKHGNFDSYLISHKGKLLFESYYLHGRVNLPHPQASATKAYTGFALGRAIQLGYLSMEDLNKPLISFLKDLDPTKLVKGAEKITLEHALTMRTGIDVTKEQEEEFNKKPKKLKGQGHVQVLLETSAPITEESQRFKYGQGAELIMQVIESVVPGGAMDFIKNELLNKMGITNYHWQMNNVTGIPQAGWLTSMTSRDMVKWGTLAMNRGKWNGEQLIPEAFITKATSRIFLTEGSENHYFGKDVSNQGYGYFWWSADLKYKDKTYLAVSAQGGYGQFITLIKELDLLIVHTAHSNETPYLQLTAERILPAFIKDSSSTRALKANNEEQQPNLNGPYLGQKPPGLTPEPFAPGIISKEGWELDGVFSSDMKEFYYTLNKETSEKKFRPMVIGLRVENNAWKKFTEFTRIGEISFSPDGNRMHMAEGYRERNGNSWTERKSLGPTFDRQEYLIMRLTSSTKGTYFFDEFKKDMTGSIRYSRVINGKHEKPQLLGKKIDKGMSFHPFIAPDESYLIFDSNREGGYGSSDLYICYRNKDGSWTEAINLGNNVNSEAWEATASITPDGKYLFFNRNIGSESYENVDIYWMDAQIIETLRPKTSTF